MVSDKSAPHSQALTIYFDADMKSSQVVRPTKQFDGSWKQLADTITGGNYYKIKVQ
jgi:hypothetical protein